MRQWLAANFFSAGDMMDKPSILNEKDFYLELSMVALALALFGIVLHVFGR